MDNANFSVVITGEWPGAGQSTTAKLLSERLGFKRVYAGFLFRKFAYVWKLEKDHYTWEEFERRFVNNDINLDRYPFTENQFDEGTLHAWQLQLKQVETPDLWDKIIDQQSLLALRQPGVVVEAKVGVLLDKTGLVKLGRLKHKIFKFLLTCPPEISAHRVIKRKIENGELTGIVQDGPEYFDLVRETTTETINRHLRDWERYEKIYGIFRSSIYKPGIIKVSTAERSEAEVVNTIMDILEYKQSHSKLVNPV
jgi:cytidylate kinase